VHACARPLLISSLHRRYIPRYAAEIADRNFELTTKAAKEGKKPDASKLLNLKRIAVGNGLTDITVQTTSYYDFTCTQAGLSESRLSAAYS
jgi:hypothetical protein